MRALVNGRLQSKQNLHLPPDGFLNGGDRLGGVNPTNSIRFRGANGGESTRHPHKEIPVRLLHLVAHRLGKRQLHLAGSPPRFGPRARSFPRLL